MFYDLQRDPTGVKAADVPPLLDPAQVESFSSSGNRARRRALACQHLLG